MQNIDYLYSTNLKVMKTIGIVTAILLSPIFVMAQGNLKPMDEAIPAPAQSDYKPSGQTVVYKSNTTPIQQSTGKVYNEEDLTRMPRRDVNTIAGTVTGVDSRPGTNEIPHIRGAETSGTAYYVDGVRIYGAMPIMTR
jgi:outer membrane receptor for ferrienterochelin and colicin